MHRNQVTKLTRTSLKKFFKNAQNKYLTFSYKYMKIRNFIACVFLYTKRSSPKSARAVLLSNVIDRRYRFQHTVAFIKLAIKSFPWIFSCKYGLRSPRKIPTIDTFPAGSGPTGGQLALIPQPNPIQPYTLYLHIFTALKRKKSKMRSNNE